MAIDETGDKLTILAIYPWDRFWSMGEGSGAPSFYLSVTSFPRHGHNMHVLMPAGRERPGIESYHGLTLHRFRTGVDFMPECGRSKLVHHMRIFGAFVYWFVRAVPAGISLARSLHPDVVFGMGSLGSVAGWLVGRACRTPNVTRLFGSELSEVLGSPLRLMLRYRDILPYLVPASYYVMHNDGSGADKIARGYGVPAASILYWPNGIDKGAYDARVDGGELAARLGIPEGAPVVMTASRLHPQLHIERLVAAVPDVVSAHSDVRFLIAGDGEQRGELERSVAELGASDNVVFAGALHRDEMVQAYARADVFVALSDRTNTSNPLYEAMMSELAVVVLDSGTTSDVIRHDDNGVLLQRKDLPELGAILSELLSDPARMARMGKQARLDADRTLPTIEERQDMEVDVVERAVRESRVAR